MSEFTSFLSISRIGSVASSVAFFTALTINLTGAPLNISSNTELPEDTVASYDSIAVSGGAILTIGGGSDITVTGAVTVSGNSEIVFAGKNIDAKVNEQWQGEGSSLTAASVTIDSGSAIHADGQGYRSGLLGLYNLGTGPGGYQGSGSIQGNYSASHGGKGTGTAPATDPIGPVYGSMLEPTELGSSSFGYASPMQGGGAIRLIVSGTLTVNGRISADGTAQGTNHSGATGGSIWITTATLTGSGLIRANASGKGAASTNRGSGGGRVAVYYNSASGFASLTNIRSASGSDTDASEDGTVWLEQTSGGKRHLTVVGRVDLDGFETEELDSIVVEDGGSLELPGGIDLSVAESILVMDGGTVRAEGKNNTERVGGVWLGEGIHVTVPVLTIEEGGVFHADGQGYQVDASNFYHNLGTGPGGSAVSTYGASYGGSGASSAQLVAPPAAYGSLLEPTDLGSSSYGYTSRTYGGGAIHLTVLDTLTVDGRLSANGLADGTNHLGATGGSIWITTENLAGSGSVQANASPKGTTTANRHSGGGRIAVYYSDASGFDDLKTIEARSGGTDDASEDGTVFLLDVDNGAGDLIVTGRVAIPEDAFETLESISILDTGLLEIFGGATLQVNGAVDVAAGGRIVFRSKGLLKSFRDEWEGEGSHLMAGTLNLPEGASVSADGQGYLEGPGSFLRQWVNLGASHGGLASGQTEPVYGTAVRPLTPGSGGGAGITGYTAGGGALRITTSESIVLDGSITADGVAQGTSQSGATGGSIWITTPSLTGTGTIQANAAESGTVAANGDSGGGRVAIYSSSAIGLPSENIEAAGQGEAEDGTVVLEESGDMFWLDELPTVLHGSRSVSWYAGALASGQSVRLIARQDGTDNTILTSDDPVGFSTAEFGAVSNGLADLKLQVIGSGGSVVRELVTGHSIRNDINWHSGEVSGDEIWAAGTVHVIEDDLLIGKGASVTVEAGAVVKVMPGVLVSLRFDGAFLAEGTAGSPTVITSWMDDTAGGDTNADGDTTAPAVNDWNGFLLDYGSLLELSAYSPVRYSRQTWQGELEGTTHLVGGAVHRVTGNLAVGEWTKLFIEPGAIVKMADGADLVFDPNTVLESRGTPARPVVITSILDDAIGGDTNGDGDETSPAPGDWGKIETNIGVNLVDNTHILYGGDGNTYGSIGNAGGAESILTIRNSVVADAFYDAISCRQGTIRVENTVIAGADRGLARFAFADVDVVNCTFDNNRMALFQHAPGEFRIRNSIIANSLEYGIYQDSGSASDIKVSHTLFWNPEATKGDVVSVYGTGSLGQFSFTITSDGNVNEDPLFGTRDPVFGLGLSEGSPAIDAADGNLAPERDKRGRERRDELSAADTGIAKNGVVPDMGAYEFYENAPTEVDLKAVNLSGPESVMTGAAVTLEWTVSNIGIPLEGAIWKSRIYLVAAASPGSERILVGESVTEISGTFSTGAELTEETALHVPFVPEGGYLWVVDVNVANTPFEGANRVNNLVTSDKATFVGIPELTTEQLLSGVFDVESDRFAFKFRASGGSDWLIVLDAEGESGRTRLYANRGRLAGPVDASESGLPGEPDSLINLSGPDADTWYILGVAERNPDGDLPFSIAVSEVGFELLGVHPSSGSLPGPVTLALDGTGLRPDAEVVLSDGSGGERDAVGTVFDSGRLSATFDLAGLSVGAFDVVVRQGENEDTLENAFQVGTGNPGRLMTRFLLPDAVRSGRLYTAWLEYQNVGGTDLMAPVIGVYGVDGVKLGLTRDEDAVIHDALSLAAISDTDTPWILPPGYRGRLAVVFKAVSGRNVLESTTTTTATTDAMNWSEVGAAIRPDDPPDGWDDIWSLLVEEYGSTAGDYARMVGDAISRYHRETGIASDSLREPLQYLVFGVRDELVSDLSGRVVNTGSGQAVAGASVSLVHTVTSERVAATTARDGSFHLLLPAVGTYEVRVDEYLVLEGSAELEWDGKDPLAGLEIAVSAGSILEGSVRLPVGVSGDLVVVGAQRAEGDESYSVKVSELGRYRFGGLPDGRYELRAGGPGLVADGPVSVSVSEAVYTPGPEFSLGAGGSIAGEVWDAEDNPLAGATVIAIGADSSAASLTGESGDFSVSGLGTGTFSVIVATEGYKRVELGGVAVESGTVTALDPIMLAVAGTINGRVLSSGEGVPGVPVSAVSGDEPLLGQVSDSEGRFTFFNAFVGDWTVTADDPAFELASGMVTVTDPAVPVSLEINLVESEVLAGQVDASGDGGAADAVGLRLVRPDDSVTFAVTDESGAYRFGRLEPGAYTISLYDGSQASQFTVVDGQQPDSVDFSIDRGALRGDLDFPGDLDEPVVMKVKRSGAVVLEQAVANPGSYAFDYLATGDYSIDFAHSTLSFPSIASITVSANETAVIDTIAPGSVDATIRVVDDASEDPAPGALLRVSRPESGFEQLLALDANGTVIVNGLAPARYWLDALLPDKSSEPVPIDVESEPIDLELRVATSGSVSGRVADPLDTGLALIEVAAYRDGSEEPPRQFFTDNDGEYSVDFLPPGTYTLVYGATLFDGLETLISPKIVADVTVSSGTSTDLDVTLVVDTVGFEGVVSTADGSRPLSGSVELRDAEGRLLAVSSIDSDGGYRLPRPDPGSYSIDGQMHHYLVPPVSTTAVNGVVDLPLAADWVGGWYYRLENEPNSGDSRPVAYEGFARPAGAFSQSSVIGTMLGWIRAEMGEPPERQSPLSEVPNTYNDVCPCPEAIAAWEKVQRLQRAADVYWNDWNNQWISGWDQVAADVGIFGVRLGELAGSLLASSYKAPEAIADVKEAAEFLSKLETAVRAGKNLDQLSLNELLEAIEGVNRAKNLAMALFDNRGSIAGAAQSAVGIGGPAGNVNGIWDAITNPSTFSTKGGFLTFTTNLNDFVSNVSGVLGATTSAVNLLGALNDNPKLAKFGLGKVLDKLGPITDVLKPVLAAAEVAKSAAGAIGQVQRAKDNYENMLAQRDAVYNTIGSLIVGCFRNCCVPPEDCCKKRGNRCPPPPPPPGPKNRPPGSTNGVEAIDPNDKSTIGVGAGGYIAPDSVIVFTIRFENVSTATAAAQLVTITDILDMDLDWSTLELLEIGFNGTVVEIPSGLSQYEGTAEVESDPYPVQVSFLFDDDSGTALWSMKSFDPETGDYPEDAFAGFLPPNDETGRGEGYVSFLIEPKAGLVDGTEILNSAEIVFDVNDPIVTNETVNTIDSKAPTSSVAALAASSGRSFAVSWTGEDAGGAGVAYYDVYVSVNGGEWTLWQEGTTETSADYQGTPGSSYAFYVHATDALGFANPVAPTAQAQTIAGVSFLVNIANRGGVGTGPNIMIPGFVINGTGTKKVLVRAVGPELETYSVTGFLEDPELRVVSGGTVVAANDDWSDAANAAEIATVANQVGAFPLKDGSKDAAALLDLVPGSYTVKASGVGQTTGVALVEVYDVDDSANPGAKLVNISNRGEVGVGAAIMIPGFVIGGESAKTVLIRGVGPKLADYNVTGVLEDPTLRLFRAGEATPLLTNDNWSDAANAAELAAAADTVGAFALDAGSKDAAVLVTLEPGSYTVKVSGAGGTEGVALVEVYEVGD
ncbi:MAG: carboxypeptidase regulatory-like domain-containing protein [Opitutaceae bacterium]